MDRKPDENRQRSSRKLPVEEELWCDDRIIPEGWVDDASDIFLDMEGPEAFKAALLAARRNGLILLARFAPILSKPGFEFATWIEPPPDGTGDPAKRVCELSPEASEFVATAFHSNWVRPIDWRAWRKTEEARWLEANPAHVGKATEEQLAKLLTTFIRSERFCEGALLSAFREGFLTAIVERAEALLHVSEPTETQQTEDALSASQPTPNWTFKHGLDDDFIAALQELSTRASWFRDVLSDDDLIVAIRDNYLNVYADGQSLFLARWDRASSSVVVSTHPKYLVDPDLSKQVFLRETNFDVSATSPLITEYKPGTLGRMKRAARVYRGAEKRGVQRVVKANSGVVDLEIAFSMEAEREVGSEERNPKAILRKIDMACFEEIDGKIHLRFWEAKDYVNADLWTRGDVKPPVVGQVKEYERLIEKYKEDILASYKRVAKNFVSIAEMAGRSDLLCPLIKRVGQDEDIHLEAGVGLVIFGFNQPERESKRHRRMLRKLEEAAGLLVVAKGNAAGISLTSPTAAKPKDKN